MLFFLRDLNCFFSLSPSHAQKGGYYLLTISKTLTSNKKDKLFPIKLEEQKRRCILCKMPFEKTIVWNVSCRFDHLNDDNKDHSDTNLAIVHNECNLIKRYNIDYKILALDWKKYLETTISLSQSEGVSEGEKKADTHTEIDTDELTESQINLIVNQIALSQLEEFLPNGCTQQFPYSKFLNNIHHLLVKRTGGRGSEQASRRALNNLVKSEYSTWESKKLSKGNIIIQRRSQN